ncbi:MAG: NAD(P)/FAD-dependent oxidoreductase [Actinobacteria bacterium]|nr:NAD(P)/FAD-dependent oxidoreductase [Actinomycetota bacterium]
MGSAGGQRYDVVFVGSGINSLVGAALLAKRGSRVCVLEREDRFGGAVWTSETDSGFTVDLLSLVWLPFVTSPAFAELGGDLQRHGLEFANTDRPWGVLADGGRSLVMTTDHAANAARMDDLLEGEGAAWDAAIGGVFADAEDLFGITGIYPWSASGLRWAAGLSRRRGMAGTRALFADLLISARAWLEVSFRDPLIQGMLAPWVLHGNSSPDEPGTAIIARASAAFAEAGGTPMPVGGGGRVIDGLIAIIEENGGRCLKGVDVERVLVSNGRAVGVIAGDVEYAADRAVACCATPRQLYGRLLDGVDVPAKVQAEAARWRPGAPLFQAHFLLSGKPEWIAEDDLATVSVININNGLDSVSKAANEALRGLLPEEPNLCVAQPMLVDPSRGPEGGWLIYVQIGEMPSRLRGDAAGEIECADGWTKAVREAFADRVQRLLAVHLRGLDDAVVERISLSPADLEAVNINLVGGSASSGTGEIDQMLPGSPLPSSPAPRTPIKALYQIGASTHPGPSLAGASGFLLAQELGKGAGTRLRGIGRALGRS